MPRAIHLAWRGRETVDAARAALADRHDVEVQLPADFHHTVFVHFFPHTAPGTIEELDVAGGAEILARAAAIRGLDGLAQLQEPVRRRHARVRLVSPSPKIVITVDRPPA